MPGINHNTVEGKINYDICKNQAKIYELAAEKSFMMDKVIELIDCYPGLHTVDEEYATDIICEKHRLQKM